MTVRELVGRYSQTQPVFEEHGIDYCCGGGKCLTDVANEHGFSLSSLVDALEEALRAATGEAKAADKDWYGHRLTSWCRHIVETHHGYMTTALPRLRSLVPTVLKAHGAHHGDTLRQVQDLFKSLDTELSSHLIKEEQGTVPLHRGPGVRTFGKDRPSRTPHSGRHAIRSARWNTSTRVLAKPWRVFRVLGGKLGLRRARRILGGMARMSKGLKRSSISRTLQVATDYQETKVSWGICRVRHLIVDSPILSQGIGT